MNGGGLKYFPYIVISFTSKWYLVNNNKKNHCNVIYKNIAFLGKEHLASPNECLKKSVAELGQECIIPHCKPVSLHCNHPLFLTCRYCSATVER